MTRHLPMWTTVQPRSEPEMDLPRALKWYTISLARRHTARRIRKAMSEVMPLWTYSAVKEAVNLGNKPRTS